MRGASRALGALRGALRFLPGARTSALLSGGIGGVLARILLDPLGSASAPWLALVHAARPVDYWFVVAWYYIAPGVAGVIVPAVVFAVVEVWFARAKGQGQGSLPAWPVAEDDEQLALVLAEVQHPVDRRRVEAPRWLVLPERGLFTGIAAFGAIGSGKTSAIMYPLCRQLFRWQAHDAGRRAAGLILEVKGDFCHHVRAILEEAGRGADYREIGLGPDHLWQWNPLDAPWVDSYTLSSQIATLMNQLFGKGKDPFWQQAYTNLIRNIIELHRVRSAAGWVTMRDVYLCAIDSDPQPVDQAGRPVGAAPVLFERLKEARAYVRSLPRYRWRLPFEDVRAHAGALIAPGEKPAWKWEDVSDPELEGRWVEALCVHELAERMRMAGVWPQVRTHAVCSDDAARETVERLAAVETWLEKDWLKLDLKLRSSVVESLSVFLGIFDQPEIRRVFCPEGPPAEDGPGGQGGLRIYRALPRLDAFIASGGVLALNLPVGANAALARTVGVMLKSAWLQAVLRRIGQPGYLRPAAFVCDEYQHFATSGESDPAGDEKMFALTRQARCIPIVATQSISSLRSVLPSQQACDTLLQTLRTKVFLSLADATSARLAAEMCGQVGRTKASVSFSESSGKSGVSLLSGKAGGAKGTLGMSRSYSERREALFHPRDFALLDTAEAIILPFDGVRGLSALRAYCKPFYLPRALSWFDARESGRL